MKVVPNIISIFRILLVPVFIVTYFCGDHDIKLYPAIIFAVAAFSDFLDGFLARRFNASSNLGKVLDPLGDKLMTVSALVCITIDGIIPIWAVLVVCVKEILMAIGGYVLHKVARVDVAPANLLGKTSTVVFFIVCVALMVFRNMPGIVAILIISFAVALALCALAAYLKTYITVMKNREAKPPASRE